MMKRLKKVAFLLGLLTVTQIGFAQSAKDLKINEVLLNNKTSYIDNFGYRSACKAAGIQPIDSVFSDVADMLALKENVKVSKGLGFEGMGCIHPRQIPVIHEGFAPDSMNGENTLPTYHKKIMKASVVKMDYTTITSHLELLWNILQTDKNQLSLVTKMKEIVPEYISQNSPYCKLDIQVKEEIIKQQ